MVPIDKYASRIWRGRIREILNRDWDPVGIGDGQENEYDGYVGKIAAMIRDDASDEELLAYLKWVEVECMGLGEARFNRKRCRKVIASLRTLGPPPQSN